MTINNPPILKCDAGLKTNPKSSRRGGRPCKQIQPGTRFGRLVVTGSIEPANRRSRSVCRCDCGNIVIRYNTNLKSGLLSCGCLLSDAHKKHGLTKHGSHPRLFRIWCGMKTRCYNKNSNIFKYYGGRGISICKDWISDFKSFNDWALSSGYSDDKSIDRINPDGNYEPSNCRWVGHKEQCLNRRSNIHIEIDGVKKLVPEWCEKFGTPEKLARSRIKEGKKGIDIFIPPQKN